MSKEAEEPESFVDLDVSRDGPMRFRYVPRLAAVGYCACAQRPYRAYEFLSLGRLLWSVDLYNGAGLRVQIFGLTYADFDPDIDPAAIDSDFKFQLRVTAELLEAVHNWRLKQRNTPSLSSAIRILVEKGLEAEGMSLDKPMTLEEANAIVAKYRIPGLPDNINVFPLNLNKACDAELKRAIAVRKAHEKPTPISEILAANTYLKKLHEKGEISLHEYIRRALIAAMLKERHDTTYGAHPESVAVYAQDLQDDPDYFSKKACIFGDGFTGRSFKGHPIPSIRDVFVLEGGIEPYEPIGNTK